MENEFMKSKIMYWIIIIFTILLLVGNLMILFVAFSSTKLAYTSSLNVGGGLTRTLTADSPIYSVLEPYSAALIVLVTLVEMSLLGYFLFCFVKGKTKTGKILGIVLYGIIALVSLFQLRILIGGISLLVVAYLANIKIRK